MVAWRGPIRDHAELTSLPSSAANSQSYRCHICIRITIHTTYAMQKNGQQTSYGSSRFISSSHPNPSCRRKFHVPTGSGGRDGFHQVAQMMDSIMLDTFAPMGFTKVTARPSRPQRRSHSPPPQSRNKEVQTGNSHRRASPSTSPNSKVLTNKWVASLRKRDPELQPTLPSINKPKSNASLNFPKPRSFENTNNCLNAVAYKRERRSSKTRHVKKGSSDEGRAADEIKEDGKENSDDPKAEMKEMRFEPIGYEHHLVETIEKDILQRDTAIRWGEVAGLCEAKSVLQEAMVLPLLLPDYFKDKYTAAKKKENKTVRSAKREFLKERLQTSEENCQAGDKRVIYADIKKERVGYKARFYAPSTIFIDEIDSLCSQRGTDSEHEASRRFKAELLIQMDGISSCGDEKVIMVLAATNHPWDIDEAFRRRFEKRIFIPLPDYETRKALLQLCLKNVQLDPGIDCERISKQLDGYTCSDIINVCRDAALMSMRRKIMGRSPEEIKKLTKSEVDLPVTATDFKEAVSKCKKSVNCKDIARYKNWIDEFGSC
ncbi:unnamed protein product [Nezara viridula]|uniref:Katanin p60 ATPase-containing subunit A1 n=1 Tax=Nezara viridula TaxID=85310 RepID=A0A9P0HHJ9_NEZVI|nr:unnamed protein product [Nezara viridula]